MVKKNLLSGEKSGKSSTAVSTGEVGKEKLTEEERNDRFNQFQLTGDFEKDFLALCELNLTSISVVVRAKRPQTSPLVSPLETIVSKTKDDKKNSPSAFPDLPSSVKSSPQTYTICENDSKYFDPRLEIETEEEGNKIFIKELYMRGCLFEKRIIDVLSLNAPQLERVSLLDFWRVGLNDDTLSGLASFILLLPNLKTLRLDGNDSIDGQKFDIFISEKSILQNLSLRCCGITNKGVLFLSNVLVENKTLLTLNLCFNQITDIGAAYLAKSLKMNRCLLSLNLANNKIGDKGAKSFAEALSTFPLTHDQVVARRYLNSIYVASDESFLLTPTVSNATTPERLYNIRSFSSKEEKRKDKNKKKDPVKLKENAVKRGPSNGDTNKNVKGKNKGATKAESPKAPPQDVEKSREFTNPLLERVEEKNGELWIPGNRSLINLNLARNQIGVEGLEVIYSAVKYQIEKSSTTNLLPAYGLLRLSMQKNSFPLTHPVYVQLQELMVPRDPLYVPTVPASIEESEKGS